MSIEERLAVAEYSQVECYNKGYKDAVDKACEWLKCKKIKDMKSLEGNNYFSFNIEDFKKAMEE